MKSKNLIRLAALFSLAGALAYSAGCSVDYPNAGSSTPARITTSGSADFSSFVSVGNSLTAGYQSGGLSQKYQVNSYPAIIARQLGIDSAGYNGTEFQQPLITDNGTTGILTLSVGATGPTPVPATGTTNTNNNLGLGRSYDNMAVPGAFVYDFLNAHNSTDSWSITRFGSTNSLFDLIGRGLGTQYYQITTLQPTFIIWWEGHNDILGYATSGAGIRGDFQSALVAGYTGINPSDPLATAFGYDFDTGYKKNLDSLAAISGAEMIVGNIPDVTALPYFTTIFPSSSVRGTLNINGVLVPDSLVTSPTTKAKLYYQEAVTPDSIQFLLLPVSSLLGKTNVPGFTGLPYGLHPSAPIQGKYTLTYQEVASVQAIVTSYNSTIASAAAAKSIPVVDFYSLFNDVKAVSGSAGPGYPIGSGVSLKTDFISGGLFSLDGVHPSTVGYAFVANEWIKAINSFYNSHIPLANIATYLNAK